MQVETETYDNKQHIGQLQNWIIIPTSGGMRKNDLKQSFHENGIVEFKKIAREIWMKWTLYQV